MPRARRSVFVNVLAWVFLSLVVVSAILALLYARGPSEIELGTAVKLKTSSAALIIMVFFSVSLMTLVGLFAKGEIQLFDKDAGPQPGFAERHRGALMALAGVAGLAGIVWLLVAHLRG